VKQQDGIEIIAHWREVGEWWAGDQPREFVQYLDGKGIKRARSRNLPKSPTPTPVNPVNRDEHTEEPSLRPRKFRDEKVSYACGFAPKSYQIHDRPTAVNFAPLHVLSGYSFGRSTLFCEEIARQAANYGYPAVGLVDTFALTGAIEFSREAKRVGVKPIIGASIELECGGEIVLIASDKRGYQNLSRLITECHMHEERLFPLCDFNRLRTYAGGLLCLTGGDVGHLNRLLMARDNRAAHLFLCNITDIFGRDKVFIEIERSFLPWQINVNNRLLELSTQENILPIAGGVWTHTGRSQFPAQDVLLCAQTLCQVEEVVGRKPQRHPSQVQVPEVPVRSMNAERFFHDPHEWSKLFEDRPDLLENTLRLVDRCDEDVLPSRTRLPQIVDNPAELLKHHVFEGAKRRHNNLSAKLKRRIDAELERIRTLNFADHFLIISDACLWAESQKILFSGRGSVVDSAVAYCLGLSRIDAFAHNLHFDRFLPADGSKRPDIDIDFEAKRRDDVRSYLSNKYGAEHVATVSAIGAFCTRGIVREVGKALGFPEEWISSVSKRLHGGVSAEQLESAIESRPELRDSRIPKERFRWVFKLAGMLADVPRNMRAHSSGVVISDQPLSYTVPLMHSGVDGVQIIQWDKRSAKYYFDKFDLLCLRGQDVLSGAQERIRLQDSLFEVEKISIDDPETYRAMRSGELIGIPQSASPAMRQAHIRLRTETLHDASLVQAGIRPGVGGAVKINTLIARRRGTELYTYEHPDLEPILGHSYGIVVFQEQIDQLLQHFCGYSSGEAEDIRDKIHKRRREDYGLAIKEEVLRRIQSRGFDSAVAEHVFELIRGFKGYGFAQGHALAFAEISLRSIYCQQNYPTEYFSSLLDAQPAGYYGPCTLVNEARLRGVTILPVDINRSQKRFEIENVLSEMNPHMTIPNGGIRVSFNQISGLSAGCIERTLASAPFSSIWDYAFRAHPSRDELEALIMVGAFDSLHPHRRGLLWAVPQVMAFAHKNLNPLDIQIPEQSLPVDIEDFSQEERAIRERHLLGLDVKQHLMAFERSHVSSKGGISSSQAKALKPGTKAFVVGNPIRLRFPPTPSGKRVVFFDLEDESGLLNVTCFDAVYRRDGHAIVCSPYVTIIGEAQDRDGHTAFLARRVFSYQPKLLSYTLEPLPIPTADFLVG